MANYVTPAEQIERMQLYNQGLSDTEIALKVGIKRRAINYWRHINNLPNINKKSKPRDYTDRLKLYNLGLNDYEIGNALFYTPNTIYEWRKKLGLPAHNEIFGNQKRRRII